MGPSRRQSVLVAALGAIALDVELAERMGAFTGPRSTEAPTSADACNWLLHSAIDHQAAEEDPEALLDRVTELGATSAESIAPLGPRAIEAFYWRIVERVIEVLRTHESDLGLTVDDTPLGPLARGAKDASDLEDTADETQRAIDSAAAAFTTAWTTLAFGD